MYPLLKRIFDISAAGVALLILIPVIGVISLLVWQKLGRPILFTQTRPGLHEKPFQLIKFRTMRDACDDVGNPLPNDVRMTAFGQFLRSYSLDELPELWNILKGDMSFVGPRPLLMDYLPLYDKEQHRRHDVLPGLTGWSQVNGRNALTWEEKFALDVWYVDNASFWLDMKILAMTVMKVLRREGISHAGDVAMPRFRGSREEGT